MLFTETNVLGSPEPYLVFSCMMWLQGKVTAAANKPLNALPFFPKKSVKLLRYIYCFLIDTISQFSCKCKLLFVYQQIILYFCGIYCAPNGQKLFICFLQPHNRYMSATTDLIESTFCNSQFSLAGPFAPERGQQSHIMGKARLKWVPFPQWRGRGPWSGGGWRGEWEGWW